MQQNFHKVTKLEISLKLKISSTLVIIFETHKTLEPSITLDTMKYAKNLRNVSSALVTKALTRKPFVMLSLPWRPRVKARVTPILRSFNAARVRVRVRKGLSENDKGFEWNRVQVTVRKVAKWGNLRVLGARAIFIKVCTISVFK